MADTLLTAAQRVARKVGLDPTFTSFSESDETNDLISYINDAYLELIDALPENTPQLLDITGTISTVASTRLYSLASGARNFNVLEWSFENETESDAPIEIATPEYLKQVDPKWDETTGKPRYAYFEGASSLGFYPVPDAVYVVNYRFKKTFTELTATTDVFIVPDEWIRAFIDKRAAALYVTAKGFRDAEQKATEAERELIGIIGDVFAMMPAYAVPEYRE